MDFITLILISLHILICKGVSLREQLEHIAKVKLENLGDLRQFRRYNAFQPGQSSLILGAPNLPSHLPEAEALLPGHTLIRPALGMLKSSVKFPHRDWEGGSGVYGNIDNLGITWAGTNERVLYTGFRRNGYDLEIPTSNPNSMIIVLLKHRNNNKKPHENDIDTLQFARMKSRNDKQSLGSRRHRRGDKNKNTRTNEKRKLLKRPVLRFRPALPVRPLPPKRPLPPPPKSKLPGGYVPINKGRRPPKIGKPYLLNEEHWNHELTTNYKTHEKSSGIYRPRPFKKQRQPQKFGKPYLLDENSYDAFQKMIRVFAKALDPYINDILKEELKSQRKKKKLKEPLNYQDDVGKLIKIIDPYLTDSGGNVVSIDDDRRNEYSSDEYNNYRAINLREIRRNEPASSNEVHENVSSEIEIDELDPPKTTDPNPKLTWFVGTQDSLPGLIQSHQNKRRRPRLD